MKKRNFFLTILCLLLAVSAITAQDSERNGATNFGGEWELDVSKSELGDRNRIESMKMDVTQTETEITIERKAKRKERAGGEERGRRRGGRGRGGLGGNNTPMTYDLEGKETTVEVGSGRFSGTAKLKAETKDDGTLVLSSERNFKTPRGEMTITTNETWELSEDGKTLTIFSKTETPRGTREITMVFTKK